MEIIDAWTIYWLTRLDGLQCIIGVLGVITLSVFSLFTLKNILEDELKLARKSAYGCLIGIFMLFGLVFIPSTNEMLLIKGIPSAIKMVKVHNIDVKAERLYDALLKIVENNADSNNK